MKTTRRNIFIGATTLTVGAILSRYASAAAPVPADAPDAALMAAEAEITERYAWLATQDRDRDSHKEPWKAVYDRIYEREDYIAITEPITLTGAAVKLRRLLDREVGMTSCENDTDVPSLLQVLALLHSMVGEPRHPTRPLARDAEDTGWEPRPDDAADEVQPTFSDTIEEPQPPIHETIADFATMVCHGDTAEARAMLEAAINVLGGAA